MTKGQRAMAVAMIYPDPEKGGRGKKSGAKTSDLVGGFSMDFVDKARTVLKHAPDLAHQVLQGSEKLTASYRTARLLKVDAETHDARLS